MTRQRRRGWSVGTSLAVAALAGLQFFTGGPAFAATCSTGYDYSGEQDTNVNVQGLQGEFGKPSTYSLNDAIHGINYYDLTDTRSSCNGYSICWVQGGMGVGDVGGYVAPTGDHTYFERNDINGYKVNWNPTSDVLGSDGSGYVALTFEATSGGDYEYEVTVYSTTGVASPDVVYDLKRGVVN